MKVKYYNNIYKAEFKKENEHGKFYNIQYPAGGIITVHERNIEFI